MNGLRRTIIAIAAGVGAATLTFVNLPMRAHQAPRSDSPRANTSGQHSAGAIAILMSGR